MAGHWPSWRYGPKGEAEIFECEADVPSGWHDHPSKHAELEKPKAEAKPKAAPKKPGRPAKAAKIAQPLDL